MLHGLARISPGQLVDLLFGYDFFISYSHDDGMEYPKQLADHLQSIGYRVFLDVREYKAGTDLRTATKRRVRMSKYLVIVAASSALQSEWVSKELDECLAANRTPIVVDINDSFKSLPEESPFRSRLKDRLYIDESIEESLYRPSNYVIDQLRESFRFTRQDTLRRRTIFGSASAVIISLSVLLVYALISRQIARTQATIALGHQLAAQSELLRSQDAKLLEPSVLLAVESMKQLRSAGIADSSADRVLRSGLSVLPRLLLKRGDVHDIPLDEGAGRRGDAAFDSDGNAFVAMLDYSALNHVRVLNVTTGTDMSRIPLSHGYWWSSFGPNAESLTVQENDTTISTWDVRGAKRLATFSTNDYRILTASSDGKIVITATNDFRCRVWDVWENRIITTVKADCDSAYLSNDIRTLVTIGEKIEVWEIPSGQRLTAIDDSMPGLIRHALSPTGLYLALGYEDGTVRVWNATNGGPHIRIRHGEYAGLLRFSPDEKYLVTGSGSVEDQPFFENTARIWKISTGEEVARLQHDGPVDSVVFRQDGKQVITSNGVLARLWNAKTGLELARMVHKGDVWQVAFSNDGRKIVTVSADRQARIWQPTTGTAVTRVSHEFLPAEERMDGLSLIDFSSDGTRFISGGGRDHTVKLWDASTGRLIASEDQQAELVGAAMNTVGPYFVTALAGDETARIWDSADGRMIVGLNHEEPLSELVFSNDGKLLATADSAGMVSVWATETWQRVQRFNHGDVVLTASISPQSDSLITGGKDRVARVWSLNTGKEIHDLEHQSSVSTVSFGPDGTRVMTQARRPRLWTVPDFQEISGSLPDEWASGLAFSPDGKYLAVNNRQEVRILDVSDASVIIRMRHEAEVSDLAFSVEGNFLAAGTYDGVVLIWRVESGREVARFTHGRSVTDIVFSPDNKLVATAGWQDPTVNLWLWRQDDLIDIACSLLTRNLTNREWRQLIPNAPYQATCPEIPSNGNDFR